MIQGEDVFINGDGKISRDFCFVENAVQANLLAATQHPPNPKMRFTTWRTTLNHLFHALQPALAESGKPYEKSTVYRGFRASDVRHSQAGISKSAETLGYLPEFRIMDGVAKAVPWYIQNVG